MVAPLINQEFAGSLNEFLRIDAALLPEGQYQRHLARVDLFEEALLYTAYGKDGRPLTSYQVSPPDLAAALSGSPLSTGLLCKDVLFYERRAGLERLAVYVPARARDLAVETHSGQEPRVYPVRLPPLVWVGHGHHYHCYAVKQRPGADDRLYCAPLPNVNPNGGVCAGDVQFPAASARTIHAALDAFLSSRFSTHLAGGKSKEFPENILDRWERMGDGDYPLGDYPLGDLVATNQSVSHLLKEKAL